MSMIKDRERTECEIPLEISKIFRNSARRRWTTHIRTHPGGTAIGNAGWAGIKLKLLLDQAGIWRRASIRTFGRIPEDPRG
jgi:hypothetical protein